MARKAVQGYPEKSYYDNTRYLGIVATTDPLNEGLFRHLVNFNISDTGQSVAPRKGLLTTRLKLNANYLSFSNQTIIFKDNNINEYIIYDFKNNKGYIADVNAYRIVDKLLPVTLEIINFNWRGTEDRPFSTLEILINEITYLQTLYNEAAGASEAKLNVVQTYVQENIQVRNDSKVEHIYDENGIHKTLLKAELVIPGATTNFKFILQLYYRKETFSVGNITYPANTLNIDIVDTFTHPTLIPTERSVSVGTSIIPSNFQTLFTEATRPSGQISNLGNFIYVYNDALEYVNNFIYRNTNYNIKPYFQLNPAFYDLNNENSATDKWAYKFEVVNTSLTDFTNTNVDSIYSSPWLKYVNKTTKPARVFTDTEQIRTGQFVLGNDNITLNHYRNARYIIFVVPNEPNATISTTSSHASGEFKTDYPNYPTSNTYASLKTTWTNITNGIKDIISLKNSIPLFTNTLFYVVDLQATTPLNPFNAEFKTLKDLYQTKYTIEKNSSSNEDYAANFLTGADLLKVIEDKKLEFKKSSITFRLLPFVVNETHTTIDRDSTSVVSYRWFFGSVVNESTDPATPNVRFLESNALFKDQQLYVASALSNTDVKNKQRIQVGTNIYENSYTDLNISSGTEANHKIVITTSNRVFVWGYNSTGQLGLNDTTTRDEPTLLTSGSGNFTNFLGAAVGSGHTYLITSNRLFSFGKNSNGQLGNGTTTQSNIPVEISTIGGIAFAPKAISAGSNHGMLLTTTGTLYTWGFNGNGELGRGNTTTGNTAPLSITNSGVLSTLNVNEKIVQITSANLHNIILTNQGRVFSWGYNLDGRLGVNDTATKSSPTLVSFGASLKDGEIIISVSAGYTHSIFLTNFGRVFGTGSNTYGQLSEASTLSNVVTPTLIEIDLLEIDETIVKIIAGYRSTYLLTNTNKVIIFGSRFGGDINQTPAVLNFNGLSNDEFITEFNTAFGDAASGSTYNFTNMFITNLGKIYTWGNGDEGQLGNGSSGATNYKDEPIQITLTLNENETVKTFKNKTEWFLIKTNVVSLPVTTTTTFRYFDKRTWSLYQGVANNAFLPYVTTLINQFDLYNTVHNSFFVNNNYGFYKYNVLNGTYSLETNLNILKNVGKTPITFSSANFGSTGQPPYYRSTTPDSTVYAIQGTVIQVIGVNGMSGGSKFIQNGAGTNNQWISDGGETPPLISFIKNQIYYNNADAKFYIWENTSGTNGLLTELNNNADLNAAGFFDKGLSVIFYMKPYEESELLNKTYTELQTLQVAWGATALIQTMPVKQYGYDNLTVTYIEKVITKEPEDIQAANNIAVFESSILLTWHKNVLYISEVGRFYWFKDKNKLEFNEEIVKAIQYKTIILVFTTQNLYAVYRLETTTTTINPATNQLEQVVTGVAWVKQAVLYNLLVNKDYADVIQIFNQMVLFYSEDGQLFMIRPSTTIDDQTRFSIQYMNKAANDILKNYEVYINERLGSYGSKERIEKSNVKIKALISINHIKIFYYVPGVITYILIYDVLNNRYYVEDTLTVSSIYDKWFIESGEVYITEQNENIYFTFPFVENNSRDNYVDQTITNNFKKEGINCLIDTGNLNLNNHLTKRFRDLHVVFKNLNASDLLFNLETNIDEIIAKPFYNTDLEVTEINGASYIVPITKANYNDLTQLVDVNQISETATDALKYSLTNKLFENNNLLLDFSEYSSSKLLTHRTSILGMGKVFRLKLQFVSKGLYKLQHFGIIYKERRV